MCCCRKRVSPAPKGGDKAKPKRNTAHRRKVCYAQCGKWLGFLGFFMFLGILGLSVYAGIIANQIHTRAADAHAEVIESLGRIRSDAEDAFVNTQMHLNTERYKNQFTWDSCQKYSFELVQKSEDREYHSKLCYDAKERLEVELAHDNIKAKAKDAKRAKMIEDLSHFSLYSPLCRVDAYAFSYDTDNSTKAYYTGLCHSNHKELDDELRDDTIRDKANAAKYARMRDDMSRWNIFGTLCDTASCHHHRVMEKEIETCEHMLVHIFENTALYLVPIAIMIGATGVACILTLCVFCQCRTRQADLSRVDALADLGRRFKNISDACMGQTTTTTTTVTGKKYNDVQFC